MIRVLPESSGATPSQTVGIPYRKLSSYRDRMNHSKSYSTPYSYALLLSKFSNVRDLPSRILRYRDLQQNANFTFKTLLPRSLYLPVHLAPVLVFHANFIIFQEIIENQRFSNITEIFWLIRKNPYRGSLDRDFEVIKNTTSSESS